MSGSTPDHLIKPTVTKIFYEQTSNKAWSGFTSFTVDFTIFESTELAYKMRNYFLIFRHRNGKNY
jgi:hypothetical protein